MNTVNKSERKKSDSSSTQMDHKLTQECFTKCAKWKLNLTMTLNKTSSGLIFIGKGQLFKKLTSSILNKFQVVDSFSEINKNTLKEFEDKSASQDEEAKVDLPLNNLSNEYEHTSNDNSFFIEFDVASSDAKKDHLKNFREINNDFVEKEIHFVLNGTIHGKQIFKKDIRYTTEAKTLIKSFQHRLRRHREGFIDKADEIQRNNPNVEIKNSKFTFFTKLFSNQNIGIEFLKPNL